MCFPYVFRAVLDTLSKEVNEQMNIAAAEAIAGIAKEPVPFSVRLAYPDRDFEYGPDYFVPTPFDPRLLERVTCSVAQAAEDWGAAKNPIKDYSQYKEYLM